MGIREFVYNKLINCTDGKSVIDVREHVEWPVRTSMRLPHLVIVRKTYQIRMD